MSSCDHPEFNHRRVAYYLLIPATEPILWVRSQEDLNGLAGSPETTNYFSGNMNGILVTVNCGIRVFDERKHIAFEILLHCLKPGAYKMKQLRDWQATRTTSWKEKHLLARYLTSISNLKTSKIRGKFMLEINLWVSEDEKGSSCIEYDLCWACPECCYDTFSSPGLIAVRLVLWDQLRPSIYQWTDDHIQTSQFDERKQGWLVEK